MPSFEYQSLKKHLESRGRFLSGIANHILRTVQDNAVDGGFDIAAEDIPYEFDFLEDRWLLAEMLAERPEIADATPHNYGFEVWLREPVQSLTPEDLAFAAQMRRIGGAGMDKLGGWLEHARSLAETNAEATGASPDACYRKLLADFGSVFQEMEQKYPGAAAAIFNCREGYLPNELLPAADWIHNGGTAEEAYKMAQEGAFDLDTYVARGPKALSQDDLDAISGRHYNFLHNLPDGACADLSGTVLLGLDLHGKDLSTANFSGAVLRECDMGNGSFDDCDFSGASFHAVQAGGASFEQSIFTGARFENCNFFYADFECGDFTGAVFEGTNLDHATLDGCAFCGARFDNTGLDDASTLLAEGLPDSKAQAIVEVAHARHILWRHGQPDGQLADFSWKAVSKLDFSGKDFDGALFMRAELSSCDMSDCCLIQADFGGAVLEGCDFRNACCHCANFAGAQLHGCDFTDAQLDDAIFSQAEIHNCKGLADQSPGQAMTMREG